jgi:hypothetical protein
MPTINRSSGQESYEFQLKVSGYYSNPVPEESQKKAIRAKSIRITQQTFFAITKQQLFKTILGGPQCRVGNKYFFEGEYTFAYPPDQSRSHIETTIQTGYCWFLPILDWDRFESNEDVFRHLQDCSPAPHIAL